MVFIAVRAGSVRSSRGYSRKRTRDYEVKVEELNCEAFFILLYGEGCRLNIWLRGGLYDCLVIEAASWTKASWAGRGALWRSYCC